MPRTELTIERSALVETNGQSTIVDLFAAQVARSPNAVAVAAGNVALTYAQLDTASNRLGRELAQRGIGPGERVGIVLERSADLVIALLAVLKSGAAFIPLDPDYPAERVAFAAQNSRLKLIVTRSSIATAGTVADAAFLYVDTDAAAIAARSGLALDVAPHRRDLAYMIYTSGSTGRPKGVQIEHRGLANFLIAIARASGFSIGPADTLVSVITIAFDMAMLDMFVPLVTGARLVVAGEAEMVDSVALLQLLKRQRATIMQATPITWQLLIEAGWTGDPRLKMISGGEALSRKLADQLLDRGAELWNGYGPTETTVYSAFARVERGTGAVLLGPPMRNTQFYVCDESGALAGDDLGELVIGGDGVARGYFERPDLTNERFLPDVFSGAAEAMIYRTGDVVRQRPDGQLEYHGRSDHQVKLRGFRIELGEIESTLARENDVKEAVVIVHGEDADKSLVAFVVAADRTFAGDAWIAAVRARIAGSLPHYMMPARIIELDALPRTPNAKVDRNALAPLAHAMPAARAQQHLDDPIEAQLATIAGALLPDARLARDENLFTLGLNSLMAARLAIAIGKTFGVHVPVRAIFDAPTIAGLARCIAEPLAGIDAPLVSFNADGTQPPFIYFHNDALAEGTYCRRLATLLGSDQPIHTIAPHGSAGLPLVPTIEAMAAGVMPLVRAAQPAGPYRLGGFCAGGYVAFEVARQLRDAGERVERVVLINAATPFRGTLIDPAPLIHRIGRLARLNPYLRESLVYNIARLAEAAGTGPRAVGAFIAKRLRGYAKRTQHDDAVVADTLESFQRESGSQQTEQYLNNLVATATYHPLPYDGSVDLIWSMEQDSPHDDLPTGWRAFTTGVNLIPMPGRHVSPLHDRIDDLGTLLSGLVRA
jgi:amino acid adenylation domain-containing protein